MSDPPCVDASYAMHPDIKGYTCESMSLGYGVMHTKSWKQNINAKSSTEAELVGVSEYLPFHLLLVYLWSIKDIFLKIK